MSLIKNFICIALIMVSLLSCNTLFVKENKIDSDFDQTILNLARSYFGHLPDVDYQSMDANQKKMVQLGKKLYYDKRLSGNQTISCATCHSISKYGVDNLPVSPGDKGQFGVRNSMSVMNAYLQDAQNWDTKFKSVENQAEGPIFNKNEMNMSDPKELLNRLNQDPYYVKIFAELFPDSSPAITVSNITSAIGAFERTLVTPSRFDYYIKGDINALSTQEKLGVYSFVINCKSCHCTNLVGGGFSQKFALFFKYCDFSECNENDKGKYNVTGNSEDEYVFKVPQLRNVEKTYPYMHDGSVKTLEDAIRICSMAESNYRLEEEDVQNMAAFLKALTGKIPEHALENTKEAE